MWGLVGKPIIPQSEAICKPLHLALDHRILQHSLYASNGSGLDLGLAFLPYEFEAIERAVMTTYEGVTFPVCTAEDLIIHKAISEREKDWLDIDGVLDKGGKGLDQGYIMLWLEQFAEALERPQILQRYRSLMRAKKLA